MKRTNDVLTKKKENPDKFELCNKWLPDIRNDRLTNTEADMDERLYEGRNKIFGSVDWKRE